MKRKIFISLIIISVLLVMILFCRSGIFQEFWEEYNIYVSGNIERQAALFESIVQGICGGFVTFGALFITIIHENKKEQKVWKKERKKIREERLLTVRPFLNMKCQSVSSLRNGIINSDIDYILIGQTGYYRYAKIILSNHGFGQCKNIILEDRKCSIEQLDKSEEKEVTIYFKGLESENTNTDFSINFEYCDIFGNKYSQRFICLLKGRERELEISIDEPLLAEEEE